MSDTADIEADVCCANCGAAEIDDIKLEECDGCDLVKYCSDKCCEEHREQHEESCKRRAKELHDRKLFTQPDRTDECPICFLPMPLDAAKSTFWPCCSNVICDGCLHANRKSNGGDRCPFCRELSFNKEENEKRKMERIKAKDPAAMYQVGGTLYHQGDYDGAFEYLSEAAELENTDAHAQLGVMYGNGEGVEKDAEKAAYHFEKAAMGGDPGARHNLALYEQGNGNTDRAVKHLIIAANLGYELSMKELWNAFKFGNITKEDLDATLRSHQAAIDAMKSEQREAAERANRSERVSMR